MIELSFVLKFDVCSYLMEAKSLKVYNEKWVYQPKWKNEDFLINTRFFG